MKVTNLFMKPELVRATIALDKNQTRRTRGLEHVNESPDDWDLRSAEDWARALADNDCFGREITEEDIQEKARQIQGKACFRPKSGGSMIMLSCPYGKPGDLIYVREAHIRGHAVGGYQPHVDPDKDPSGPTVDIIYRADDGPNERSAGPWTPSIHMPRWASRLTLKIKSIRIERLQDISEEDAKAEGAEPYDVSGFSQDQIALLDAPLMNPAIPYKNGFALLWQSINGLDSWDANSWVWRIKYEPIMQNVDVYLSELEAAA